MQLWQLRRKIHTSWLIAIEAGAIVIGTALVPMVNQDFFHMFAWLAIAIVLSSIVLWKKFIAFVPLIIIAGLLIGLWRGSMLSTELTVFQNLIGKSVVMSGSVADDPSEGQHGEVQIRLGNLYAKTTTLPGKIWVSVVGGSGVKRGNVVTVKGIFSKGFASFSGSMYQAKIVTVSEPQPGDIARQVRDWFADKVNLGIHGPEASLGLGYLLGQKRALDPELQQALVATGLTHVVVASGYNLTILVRLTRRLFVRVSKYLATLSAGTMIISFMAITGASPSMSRAGLVSGLSLAAWYYGRQFHPLILLPLAASMTTLIDPTYAWNDLGWQLSFAAFGGVMILAPLLQRYFFGDKKPGTVRQILGETISAHIVTIPILVLAFGQISNVAVLSNLLVLPFVPLAMLLTFITGVSAIVAPALAPIIGLPAQWLLGYSVWVIHYFASLGWAQTILTIQPWVVAVAYVAIIVVCIYLYKATEYNLRDANIVE
jgi:competence protein ComEC